MAWRLAKSLETLRAQVNKAYPKRSKVSDGTVGDLSHAARASDHNPNAAGVVTAMDITHDPAKGVDTWKLAEILRQNKDPRIKYVISNGRIFSSQTSPWQWRPYTGANKHAQHVHVSVLAGTNGDSTEPWILTTKATPLPAPVVPPPMGTTADMRRRMAKAIVDFEARRVNGKLAVYNPPANDGGGAYEVAGINVRYHPVQAAKLKKLIELGEQAAAEASITEYLLAYTNVAAGWTTDAGAEFYLRDSVFNRGPTGAARILQRAVGVPDDGQVGQQTRAALERIPRAELLTKLRWARENYESKVVGYRANFWKGLVSRWDKALVVAQKFQAEQSSTVPPAAQKTVVVATPAIAVAWTFWGWISAHPLESAFIASGIAALIYTAWRLFQNWREKPPLVPSAPTPAIHEETPT